jgi:Uncharacterised nucleotidyltransferase
MNSVATWTLLDRCLSVSTEPAKLILCLEAIRDSRLDWVAVIAQANKSFVTPALWSMLARPELREKLPADVCSYLNLLHATNARRNARIHEQCLDVGAALLQANLRAVLLKGATWLFDSNAEAAADRMMVDIDLLVPAQDLEAAVRALVACKYRTVDDALTPAGHFHHPPLYREGAQVCVEIHRDLSYRLGLLPASDVVNAATQVAPGLLLPALRHRILHNVIHAQIENGDQVGGVLNLRDLLDLARLACRCGPDFDWSTVANHARQGGFFLSLSGAMHCAHRILQSPLPAPFARHLRGKIHAWRCMQQRRWPQIGNVLEKLGVLSRALAWERDAYVLELRSKRSLKAQVLVNKRRIERIKTLVRRRRGHPMRTSD